MKHGLFDIYLCTAGHSRLNGAWHTGIVFFLSLNHSLGKQNYSRIALCLWRVTLVCEVAVDLRKDQHIFYSKIHYEHQIPQIRLSSFFFHFIY